MLVNAWLQSWSNVMLNSHYWWLAQYLWSGKEHPGPPTLPYRVEKGRVLLHQTSDKKKPFRGEVESKSVDWDRWLIPDMHQWIVDKWGTGDPPGPTMEEKVDKLWKS